MYFIILAEIAKAVMAPNWVVWFGYVNGALSIIISIISAHVESKK